MKAFGDLFVILIAMFASISFVIGAAQRINERRAKRERRELKRAAQRWGG